LNARLSRNGNYALSIAAAFFLCAGSAVCLQAQGKKSDRTPPAEAERPARVDPLGRETPRGAIMGFLRSENRGDYAAAALYLQAADGVNLQDQLERFRALRSNFKGDIALLSDDPNGILEPGLPPGQVRAGVFQVGDMTSDVILVRVDGPTAGKMIWLVSRESLAGAARLYEARQNEQPGLVARILPAALTARELLGMTLAQWLGWLLSLPISWLLAWPAIFLLSAPRLLWCKVRKRPFKPVWETPIGAPLTYIVAILTNSISIYLLNPPLLYRAYYLRLMAALLVACFIWLFARITDHGFERALTRARTQSTGAESILILSQRFLRILLLLVAIVAGLAVAGFNMRTALAGLGIGGLAIALAAQKTLENVLGGMSLLMDKSVQVGNLCRIGNQVGQVEDVGLRSVKIRTRDQSLLVVPNGILAQMQFENFVSRRKCLINQHFALRIETDVEQLRFILDRIQAALQHNPEIEPGTSRVRVVRFAGAAFELELWAYANGGDWPKFTAMQQDVILSVAEIVAASGARFAAPTHLTYLAGNAATDTQKVSDVERRVSAGSEGVGRELGVFPRREDIPGDILPAVKSL
jgi:MscS family membrane protein